MQKHTPGPWTISDPDTLNIRGRGALVAQVLIQPNSIGAANARLIVVAPDMLDELYRLLPFMEDAERDPAYKPGVVRERVKAIRALLAKVDGQ